MASIGKADIHAGKLFREVTVRVRGLKTARVRLMVGTWFIRFGVWISGMNCEVDNGGT